MSAVMDIISKDHHLVVSRDNLKIRFQKGIHLPGSYDVGSLQDESLRENFQVQLNTKLECLKFDNVDDGGIILEKRFVKLLMVSSLSGKKVKTAARNTSEKALCLIEKRRG